MFYACVSQKTVAVIPTMSLRLFYLLLGLLATPTLAVASGHPLESLREAVRDFALAEIQRTSQPGEEVQLRVDKLDPRLHLERCAQPPELFLPEGSQTRNRLTVGVRCHAPKPWKLYIPVRIERYAQVVMASRHIPRGKTIATEDLYVSRQNVSRFSYGFIGDPQAIVGRVAKRAIQRGETLRPNQLEAAKLIGKDDKVSIIARGKQFSIRMSGIALRDGALGERIPVRNSSSGRTIEAKVIGEAVVEVSLH